MDVVGGHSNRFGHHMDVECHNNILGGHSYWGHISMLGGHMDRPILECVETIIEKPYGWVAGHNNTG